MPKHETPATKRKLCTDLPPLTDDQFLYVLSEWCRLCPAFKRRLLRGLANGLSQYLPLGDSNA